MDIKEILNSTIYKRILDQATKVVGKKNKLLLLCTQVLSRIQKGDSPTSVAKDALHQIKVLVDLIQCTVTGKYKDMQVKSLVTVVAALIYFLSPIDIIPDFIPLLGFVDDFALISWVFSTISSEVQLFEKWRSQYQVREV